MDTCRVCRVAFMCGFVLAFCGFVVLLRGWPDWSLWGQTAAAWVQAIGVFVAIAGSYYLGAKQSLKSHQSALDLERMRLESRAEGLRSVVQQLLVECNEFAVAVNAKKTSWEFSRIWVEERGPALMASLNAFDSMPIYELGSFKRVELAFRIRELASVINHFGEKIHETQDMDFGYSEFLKCRRNISDRTIQANKLSIEFNASYSN